MRYLTRLITLVALAAGMSLPAFANTITVDGVYHFRDNRSANSVGFSTGDQGTFGADSVLPSGDENGDGFADSHGSPVPATTGIATQGGATAPLFFIPFTHIPNQFANTIPYDSGRTGSWELTFTNGTNTKTVATPTIDGVGIMPFVSSFSLVPNGTTPAFQWSLPAGSPHNAQSLRIWDLEEKLSAGIAPAIFADSFSPDATTFAMPAGVLEANHRYSVSIQLDKFAAGNFTSPGLRARSRAFFDFSTSPLVLPSGEVSSVFLPSVDSATNPQGEPVYQFNVAVKEGETIFIDPEVAVGYEYAIGTGDPKFASVVLPDVGDGVFDLLLYGTGGEPFDTGINLVAGTPYDFSELFDDFGIGKEGLSRFAIGGIEPSAGLDPFNPTAFVTGLTFVGAGSFTGTMTPITPVVAAAVSEPPTLAVVLMGLLGMVGSSRLRADRLPTV